jgi:hypothetical protein
LNAPQIPERVDYWLGQWARYMRHDGTRHGYPTSSLGLMGGGESQRWADWADDEEWRIWVRNVKAMDAAINDLPGSQRVAICHVYLGQVAQFPRDNLMELMEAASNNLLAAMEKRDIW